jgi:hypothetical protein
MAPKTHFKPFDGYNPLKHGRPPRTQSPLPTIVKTSSKERKLTEEDLYEVSEKSSVLEDTEQKS